MVSPMKMPPVMATAASVHSATSAANRVRIVGDLFGDFWRRSGTFEYVLFPSNVSRKGNRPAKIPHSIEVFACRCSVRKLL